MEIGGKRKSIKSTFFKRKSPRKKGTINPLTSQVPQEPKKRGIVGWLIIIVVIIAVCVGIYYLYKWFTTPKEEDKKDKGTDGSSNTNGPVSAARTAIMTPFYANEEILKDLHPSYKLLYTTYKINEPTCPTDALYCTQLKTDIGQFFTTNTSPTAEQFKTFWKNKLLENPYNYVWPGDASYTTFNLIGTSTDMELIVALSPLSTAQRTNIYNYIYANSVTFNTDMCTFLHINKVLTSATSYPNTFSIYIYNYLNYLYTKYNLPSPSLTMPAPTLPIPQSASNISFEHLAVYMRIKMIPNLEIRTAIISRLNNISSFVSFLHNILLVPSTNITGIYANAKNYLSDTGVPSIINAFYMPGGNTASGSYITQSTVLYYLIRCDLDIQRILETVNGYNKNDMDTYFSLRPETITNLSVFITGWIDNPNNATYISSITIYEFRDDYIAYLKNEAGDFFTTI